MTTEERAFLVLWGLNLLLAGAYGLLMTFWWMPRQKKAEKEVEDPKLYLLRAGVMVLCPVIGPLYFLCSYVLAHTIWYREVDLSDVKFQKIKARTFATTDEERERDLAPVEETLQVGSQKSLRSLMLNVLRGDLENSLGSIALALNSSDSETAHYAASVLRDELNNFRLKVQQMTDEMQTEAEDRSELEVFLVDYMSKVLEQKVFSEMEQAKYVKMLDAAAESLYHKNPESMTPQRYESLNGLLLKSHLYERAQIWCDRLKEQYPEELATYTCQLKLYFTESDSEHFFEVLEQLKQSDVVIDKKTLEMIRVFQ